MFDSARGVGFMEKVNSSRSDDQTIRSNLRAAICVPVFTVVSRVTVTECQQCKKDSSFSQAVELQWREDRSGRCRCLWLTDRQAMKTNKQKKKQTKKSPSRDSSASSTIKDHSLLHSLSYMM